MSCRKQQKNLSALLDGELDDALAQSLSEHLARCASCQKEKAKLERSMQALGTYAVPSPSPSFDSDFSRRLRLAKAEQEKARSPRRFLLWGGFATATAAAAIALFALGVWRGGPAAPAQIVDVELAQNLELLEDYDVVSSLDILEDFDVVSNLDSLMEDEG
jgi:anti-sigma factor RsiW